MKYIGEAYRALPYTLCCMLYTSKHKAHYLGEANRAALPLRKGGVRGQGGPIVLEQVAKGDVVVVQHL